MSGKTLNIRLPFYTLGEEIFNAVSHGIGAAFSIPALVMMTLRAHGGLPAVSVCLFGVSMIMLYTVSCVYHALSRNLEGKKVLRVIDHCNVYALVLGTYIPVSLLGVGGTSGWVLFGIVCFCTVLGITLTAIRVDRFRIPQVFCHLLSGWSILLGWTRLTQTMGRGGTVWLLFGGIFYTVGSVLYGVGSCRRYTHSVFHVFCLMGSFCHFIGIYGYLL